MPSATILCSYSYLNNKEEFEYYSLLTFSSLNVAPYLVFQTKKRYLII